MATKQPLELCQDSIDLVVEEMKEELGVLFGYDEKNKEMGITGTIKSIEIDGPSLVVALQGRFWHPTNMVLARIDSYIKLRMPEVTQVVLDRHNSEIIDNS